MNISATSVDVRLHSNGDLSHNQPRNLKHQ